jgi:hypothetical protein
MFSVRCSAVSRLAVHSARAFLIGIFLLIAASDASAQSSVGRAANAATGASLGDAVEQNQKDFIDREVYAGSGGPVGFGAAPTGRLRSSRHDALEIPFASTENFAWTTQEGSAFATGVYSVPGIVLGGQLKLSVFGGHNWLYLEMRNGGGNTLSTDVGQQGKARNESALIGGTALWSSKNTYAMATVVGMWGQTTLSDAIDFCGATCVLRLYNFDTTGFMGSLTAGHVFALSRSPTGPMLDLRGVASYMQSLGDTFINFEGGTQTWTFSTWTLTGSATLFANVPVQNSALLRPYVQGYVRQEVGYRNKLQVVSLTGTIENILHDQAHTYGGVDAGLTYALGKMTLGAAIYYEGSADESTLGGRLGASWKLN